MGRQHQRVDRSSLQQLLELMDSSATFLCATATGLRRQLFERPRRVCVDSCLRGRIWANGEDRTVRWIFVLAVCFAFLFVDVSRVCVCLFVAVFCFLFWGSVLWWFFFPQMY